MFLKQIRNAADGSRAALHQVVKARSEVTPGSLRWRRLPGGYDVTIESLASEPLQEELGVERSQTVRHAFAAEFRILMQPGEIVWQAP